MEVEDDLFAKEHGFPKAYFPLPLFVCRSVVGQSGCSRARQPGTLPPTWPYEDSRLFGSFWTVLQWECWAGSGNGPLVSMVPVGIRIMIRFWTKLHVFIVHSQMVVHHHVAERRRRSRRAPSKNEKISMVLAFSSSFKTKHRSTSQHHIASTNAHQSSPTSAWQHSMGPCLASFTAATVRSCGQYRRRPSFCKGCSLAAHGCVSVFQLQHPVVT